MLNPPVIGKIRGLLKANLVFKDFSRSPVYSSTFQACANPVETYMQLSRRKSSEHPLLDLSICASIQDGWKHIIEGILEKSLKIKSALESTGKSFHCLEVLEFYFFQ